MEVPPMRWYDVNVPEGKFGGQVNAFNRGRKLPKDIEKTLIWVYGVEKGGIKK